MKRNSKSNSQQPTRKESEPISDTEIDENLEDSFPASDPPSWTLGTNHRDAAKTQKGDDAEREA